MKRWFAALVFCFVISTFLIQSQAIATPARYRVGHDPVAMMADGILARPLGLVSTIIGSTFFVVTLPFTIPSDSVGAAKRQLIDYPAWFTFKRPLGEFGRRYERPVLPRTNKGGRPSGNVTEERTQLNSAAE